jgi:hypothetical protein
MTDAYDLLEWTFPKVTPDVHERYLYLKHGGLARRPS